MFFNKAVHEKEFLERMRNRVEASARACKVRPARRATASQCVGNNGTGIFDVTVGTTGNNGTG